MTDKQLIAALESLNRQLQNNNKTMQEILNDNGIIDPLLYKEILEENEKFKYTLEMIYHVSNPATKAWELVASVLNKL